MSNAKIISIIDHETRVLRSDVQRSIEAALREAVRPLDQKIEQLQQRVAKLEEGVPTLSNG